MERYLNNNHEKRGVHGAKVTLTIDNVKIEVPKEYTILQAAREIGIDIPTLCYLKDINEIGACRMCLVEIEGA